jgi:hypothetical protein
LFIYFNYIVGNIDNHFLKYIFSVHFSPKSAEHRTFLEIESNLY